MFTAAGNQGMKQLGFFHYSSLTPHTENMSHVYCEETEHTHMVTSLYSSVVETEESRDDTVTDV